MRFGLIPYPVGELPEIQIVGEVERNATRLSIHYDVRGEVAGILLPAPATPLRNDDLWRATCFEFFLALPGADGYWEFNMSPSGEWNVYRMDAYRQVNMREETRFHEMPFQFVTGTEHRLDIEVDMSPIIKPEQAVQLGVTAIIQTADGSETYWALSHPGAHADFHLRPSFLLEL